MTIPNKIAVLMTCHNRRTMTMASLESLFKQNGQFHRALDVYLVDDGSTDGTSETIRQSYPQVTIIQGTGNLYWNGGMRLAFTHASQSEYDYHLWLNDDVILYPNALETLIQTYHQLRFPQAIICGSTRDKQTGSLTSGGFRFDGIKLLFRFDFVEPTNQAQHCDTFSGNCVLIPKAAFQKVSILNPVYTHYLGDIDYGLRAQKQGVKVWIAPGYIGTCSLDLQRTHEAYKLESFSELWYRLFHPKGLTLGQPFHQRLLPISEWTAFLKYHEKYLWFIPWILTYRKLMSVIIARLHIFCWSFWRKTLFSRK